MPPSARLLRAFITSAMHVSTTVLAIKCADVQASPNAIPGINVILMNIHALKPHAKLTPIAHTDISATIIHALKIHAQRPLIAQQDISAAIIYALRKAHAQATPIAYPDISATMVHVLSKEMRQAAKVTPNA